MNYFNELITALEKKDETAAILIMKEHGNQFNKYEEFNGNTILTYAIKNKLNLFANTLLKDELLLNIPDSFGNTPLHLAINRDLEDLAILLIKFKCDSNIPNNTGITPMFLAIRKGMFPVLEELTNNPDIVNQINPEGNNALLECIYQYKQTSDKEYVDFAKKIIDKNIDLSYSNTIENSITYKQNALTLSLENECVDIAKIIIKTGKGINYENKQGKRPLTLCIEKGYENLGNALLAQNIDLSYMFNGDTPLTLAIKNDCYSIADNIVSNRFLITDRDYDRNYPIGLAIKKGLEKLTSKIIDIQYSHEEVATIANNTDFPLTLAIKYNQLKIAEELILKCKDVAINVYDKDDNSPFALALSKGLDSLCKLMINNGLKINDYSNKIETHLTMAIISGRTEVVKELVNHNVELKQNKRFESPDVICRNYQMTSMLTIIHKNFDLNSHSNFTNDQHSFNNPVKVTNDKYKVSSEVKKKIKNML